MISVNYKLDVQVTIILKSPESPYLMRESRRAHHLNDVERRPADVITQHLKLKEEMHSARSRLKLLML